MANSSSSSYQLDAPVTASSMPNCERDGEIPKLLLTLHGVACFKTCSLKKILKTKVDHGLPEGAQVLPRHPLHQEINLAGIKSAQCR